MKDEGRDWLVLVCKDNVSGTQKRKHKAATSGPSAKSAIF